MRRARPLGDPSALFGDLDDDGMRADRVNTEHGPESDRAGTEDDAVVAGRYTGDAALHARQRPRVRRARPVAPTPPVVWCGPCRAPPRCTRPNRHRSLRIRERPSARSGCRRRPDTGAQVLQATIGSMATSWPNSTSFTPAPTSTTVPATSCPKMTGAWTPVSGCRYPTGTISAPR